MHDIFAWAFLGLGKVTFIAIGLGVLFIAIAVILFRKPSAGDVAPRRPVLPAPIPVDRTVALAKPLAPTLGNASASGAIIPTTEMPAALGSFRLVRFFELEQQQVDDMLVKLRRIPRPPHSLHKLVSPQFLADASSADISELLMSEPQVAAKVLSAVNSTLFGLPKPLGSIGQATTFLGMNTVRGICMQYMLDDSLKADNPEIKSIFNTCWNASALASELCFKLAQLLQLQDPGALVSNVVLSYLGPLATYSLLPKAVVMSIASQSLLERARVEQEQLGLSAAEIGNLLMREWNLPEAIIDDVRDIELILVTPVSAMNTQRGARLALCYLCVRLGEKLANGEIRDLREFDVMAQDGPDFYHVRAYMGHSSIARLVEFLHFPEVVAAINKMVSAIQMRR